MRTVEYISMLESFLIRKNVSQDDKIELAFFLIDDILKIFNATEQQDKADEFLEDVRGTYGKKEEEK